MLQISSIVILFIYQHPLLIANEGWIESEHLPAGDPRLLLYTVDYAGNVCGIDDMEDRPYGYALPSASYVCVDECPTVTDANKFFCEGDDW